MIKVTNFREMHVIGVVEYADRFTMYFVYADTTITTQTFTLNFGVFSLTFKEQWSKKVLVCVN